MAFSIFNYDLKGGIPDQKILDRFIENKKAFIEKVVNTRNYQTHHDKELKERAANGEDLYRLTQKLKMCLEICLLTELGFSSEEIKALFFQEIGDINMNLFNSTSANRAHLATVLCTSAQISLRGTSDTLGTLYAIPPLLKRLMPILM